MVGSLANEIHAQRCMEVCTEVYGGMQRCVEVCRGTQRCTWKGVWRCMVVCAEVHGVVCRSVHRDAQRGLWRCMKVHRGVRRSLVAPSNHWFSGDNIEFEI